MDDGSRKYKTLPIPWDRAHARRIQETVESIAKNVEKGLSIDEAIQRTDISDAPKISREPNPQLILDAWKNYEKFKIDTEGLDQASFNKKYGGEANKECNPPRKKAQGQTFLRVKANAKAEDANDLLNKVGDGMEPGSRYRQQVVRQTADFLRFATGKQSGSLLDPEKWMPPVKGGLGIYTGTKSTKAQQKQKPSIALTDDEILNLLESLPVNHKQKSHAREAKKWEFAIQLCACFGLRPVELLHLEIKKGVLWTNYIKRSGGASWKDAAAAVDMDYRTLRRYVRVHPDSLQFLEEQTKDHLDQSHSVLIASAPAVAERLLQIALDPNTKNYAAVSACQAVFAIIDKGVTDRENAEQLRAIRESLNALEGGRVIDL